MKITGIEPITCESGIGGRDWLFVKVTTDEGIVGWGEGYDWQASIVARRGASGSWARRSSARTRGASTSSRAASGTAGAPAFRSG